MADVRDWVHSKLTNHAGTAALVGTRVYAVRLPQSPTMPAITIQTVSEPREHAFGSDPGIAHATVQVTAWAETIAGARALGAQVKSALNRVTGAAASITVQYCTQEMRIEGYDDGPQRYREDRDFVISYQEP